MKVLVSVERLATKIRIAGRVHCGTARGVVVVVVVFSQPQWDFSVRDFAIEMRKGVFRPLGSYAY